MNRFELILASDYEEFYFENTDEPVPDGHPVGVEENKGTSIDFILFNDIYHQFKYDEEED